MLGGCLSAGLAAIAVVPADTLTHHQAVATMPDADRTQLLALHSAAGPAAVGTLVTLVLPAVVLVALGFAVRRGHRRPTAVARGLCIVMAALLALWTLASLSGGLSALPVALVQACIVALLWRAGRLLHPDQLIGDAGPTTYGPETAMPPPSSHRRSGASTEDDPWDTML